MAIRDPLADINRLLANPLARRTAAAPASTITLSPDEEQSLIGRAGNTALSGISAVGNLLDLPGSMVRDLLGGQMPLDQLISPFSADNRLTGRDLLRKWGAVTGPDTTANWWGGLGAELLTDPLTYLTFGSSSALTGAGKAAKAAGVLSGVSRAATKKAGSTVGKLAGGLTNTLTDVVKYGGREARQAVGKLAAEKGQTLGQFLRGFKGEKLSRGIAGIGLPFMEPAVALGGGARGLKAAKLLDAAGEAVRYGKYSPVRPLAALFDHTTQGLLTPSGQKQAAEVTGGRTAAIAGAREAMAPIARQFEDLNQKTGMFDPARVGDQAVENSQWVRRYLEESHVPRGDVTPGGPDPSTAWRDLFPDHLKPLMPALDQMKRSMSDIRAKELAAGLPSPELDDFVKYFPRQTFQFGLGGGASKGSKLFDTTTPFQIARRSPLKGHTGGTAVLNEMSLDPQISGLASTFKDGKLPAAEAEAARRYIAERYIGRGITPGEDVDWEGLTNWVTHLDPRHAQMKIPAYEVNPVYSALSRVEHGQRAIAAADGLVNLLGEMAGPSHNIAGEAVNLADVLKGTNLTEVAGQRILRKARGADLFEGIPDADALKNLWVPKEIAADAARFVKSFTAPDEVGVLMEGLDKFLNLWKSAQTAVWPAFHVRNFFSGQFQNFVGGAFDPKAIGPMRYVQPMLDAHALMTGRNISGRTAEETRKLADELFAHDVWSPKHGVAGETLGANFEMGLSIPGVTPLWQKADKSIPLLERANPWRMAGAGATSDVFGASRIGRNVSGYIEGLNRIAPYIAYRKQGLSAVEAAKRVKLLQVDYRALSQFERKAMRRLFPFYSFTKGISKFMFEELAQHPGGKMAQSIRGMNRARDPNQMTPDYVAETASIPLGTTEEGSSRYLTGFGLMHEDPLSFMGGGVRGAGLEALSRANPLVKAPLEWATGQSFFQKGPLGGRQIEDLDPIIGRTISNLAGAEKPVTFPGSQGLEFLAGNSPLSRALTTARQVSDPRKREPIAGTPIPAILPNLLTGVRVSDISPAAQDALLRERLQGIMRSELGGKSFEKSYIPTDVLEGMPPEQQLEAMKIQALMNILAKRAKQRKAAK